MATPPTPEQWSAMTKLVQSFFQKADAEPFREPVDWQALGLYDYPKIIKKPMDLGTIKKSIVDRKYKTLIEANEDVKLVWHNCQLYNADGSDFYNLAQTLNKKWNDKFKKLLDDLRIKETDLAPTIPAAVNGAMRISNDEKRAFAKSLYKISKDDLGKVLVECEKKAPTALTKNSAEDEIELNVDKIPPSVFADLQAFVKQQIKAEGKPTKKKASGGGTGGAKRQKAS